MLHCINHSHPEVIKLSEKMELHPVILASKIAVWQDDNNVYDRFPSLEELTIPKESIENIENEIIEDIFLEKSPIPFSTASIDFETINVSNEQTDSEILQSPRFQTYYESIMESAGIKLPKEKILEYYKKCRM